MSDNPYAYENSPLAELFAEQGLPPREELFSARLSDNKAEPAIAVLTEQPWHRLAMYMKVQGASNKAIAKHVGKTPACISNLMRQPWARARMAEIANEQGLDDVQTILKGALADSIHRLIELRDDPDVPSAVQRGCCTDLIHQYLGKPKQQLEHTTGTGMDHLSDEELRELVSATPTTVTT